jgi:hypothetical protein
VDLPDPDGGGPLGDPSPGSPLAAELGFQTTNSAILGVTVNTTDFDDANPGNVVFAWQDTDALGGTGACDSGSPGNCPVGLQWAGAGDTAENGLAPNNQAFAAFGSVDYGTDADGKVFATFITRGPNTGVGGLAPSLQVLGTYGSGDDGRIAELNPAYDGDGTPPISINHDTYNQTASRSVIGGDADLNGDVDAADLSLLLGNFYIDTGRKWYHGNFDNQLNDDINAADLSILLGNFYVPAAPVGSGGAGGAGGVPEPATMALVALASLGLIGLRRRK